MMARATVHDFAAGVWTIMVKELRSRMRGRRAFVVLTLYLSVLALIAYGVYVVVAPNARDLAAGGGVVLGFGQANASALVGQTIFSALSIFQVILVAMIAPAFTAGQISLEREKQTLDLLVTTPLRPGAIILGKLLTALAFVVLMIVAAVPISAIVLMYGGASVYDILRQQILLLSVAVGFGAIGLFASALLKRTQAATVLTYSIVLALTLGTAMIFAFWTQLAMQEEGFAIQPRDGAPEQLRYLNPMVGMLDIISAVESNGPTRLTRALYELFGTDLSTGQVTADCFEPDCPQVGGDDGFADGQAGDGYWWPRISVSFLVLATLLTIASVRLVVPAGMRWAFRREASRPTTVAFAAQGSPMIEELSEPER